MDLIGNAIEKGREKSNIAELRDAQWEDFHKACRERVPVLYGAGEALRVLVSEYPELPVSHIVDGDENKWGKSTEELYPEAYGTTFEGTRIEPAGYLEEMQVADTVILITMTKSYEQVYTALRNMGFEHIYSFLCVEANMRAQVTFDDELYLKRTKERYLDRCLSLPIDHSKIVFQSFLNFTDHGKYITEALLAKDAPVKIVWITGNENAEFPEGVQVVSVNDWKSVIREMETAGIWVINSQLPEHVIKREGQIYIHTKHWASVTLKKFYLDAPTILKDPERKKSWEKEFGQIDHMITGSTFDEESCRRGFAFKGKFIRAGSPRTDAMFERDKYRKKIFEHYGIPADTNVILYAPTYRFDMKDIAGLIHENRLQLPDLDRVRRAFSERFGGDWLIMRRLHPSLTAFAANEQLPEGVMDVTIYEDGQELCAACDAMISDYSSIMFEPAFVGRPVFLYAPDRDEYIHKEYDLLIDYDSLPFPIAETNEELLKNIAGFDEKSYKQKVERFLDEYGVHEDGHASERAADYIISLIDDNR